MMEIPFYVSYSKTRRFIYKICSNKYFDLCISGIIGLNVITMSLEFFGMPKVSSYLNNFILNI